MHRGFDVESGSSKWKNDQQESRKGCHTAHDCAQIVAYIRGRKTAGRSNATINRDASTAPFSLRLRIGKLSALDGIDS